MADKCESGDDGARESEVRLRLHLVHVFNSLMGPEARPPMHDTHMQMLL